jgi:hypothetical protein
VEHGFIERRRSPRVATAQSTLATRSVSTPVLLLELSSDGMLLVCQTSPRVGESLRVMSGLAGRRLHVALNVRHVSSRWDREAGGYLVGGSFQSLDPSALHTIEALLGASEPFMSSGATERSDRRRLRTPAPGIAWHEQPAGRGEVAPPAGSWIPSAP